PARRRNRNGREHVPAAGQQTPARLGRQLPQRHRTQGVRHSVSTEVTPISTPNCWPSVGWALAITMALMMTPLIRGLDRGVLPFCAPPNQRGSQPASAEARAVSPPIMVQPAMVPVALMTAQAA